MKQLPATLRCFLAVLALAFASSVLAASTAGNSEVVPAAATWHAQTLGQAIGYMLLFAAIGIAAAIVGYKVFDRCTPGDLHKEIVDNRNVAAAIVAAAVILGICLIIAAAMIG